MGVLFLVLQSINNYYNNRCVNFFEKNKLDVLFLVFNIVETQKHFLKNVHFKNQPSLGEKMLTSQITSIHSKRLLKFFHLLSAGLWIGGTATLTALICLFHPENQLEYTTKNTLLIYLDYYIIAPGAAGCFITGLIYGFKTKYGFFRHKWIICKWIINISFIIFGALVVVPWLENSIMTCSVLTQATEPVPESINLTQMHAFINITQWSIILFALYLSVFKPWSKKQNKQEKPSVIK